MADDDEMREELEGLQLEINNKTDEMAANPNDMASNLPDDDDLTEEQREAKGLMLEIDTNTNESLESTRRMVNLCEESKDAGMKTLVMLDEQGEQLENIEEKMKEINSDMRVAEKTLEEMEKCCGLCTLPWNKKKNFEKSGDYDATWKASEDGQVNSNQPRQGDQLLFGGRMCTRITNDAREDEMENNMQEVNTMVGNLRNMAVDMGTELESQNSALNRINKQAASNDNRISEANKRTAALM